MWSFRVLPQPNQSTYIPKIQTFPHLYSCLKFDEEIKRKKESLELKIHTHPTLAFAHCGLQGWWAFSGQPLAKEGASTSRNPSKWFLARGEGGVALGLTRGEGWGWRDVVERGGDSGLAIFLMGSLVNMKKMRVGGWSYEGFFKVLRIWEEMGFYGI